METALSSVSRFENGCANTALKLSTYNREEARTKAKKEDGYKVVNVAADAIANHVASRVVAAVGIIPAALRGATATFVAPVALISQGLSSIFFNKEDSKIKPLEWEKPAQWDATAKTALGAVVKHALGFIRPERYQFSDQAAPMKSGWRNNYRREVQDADGKKAFVTVVRDVTVKADGSWTAFAKGKFATVYAKAAGLPEADKWQVRSKRFWATRGVTLLQFVATPVARAADLVKAALNAGPAVLGAFYRDGLETAADSVRNGIAPLGHILLIGAIAKWRGVEFTRRNVFLTIGAGLVTVDFGQTVKDLLYVKSAQTV